MSAWYSAWCSAGRARRASKTTILQSGKSRLNLSLLLLYCSVHSSGQIGPYTRPGVDRSDESSQTGNMNRSKPVFSEAFFLFSVTQLFGDCSGGHRLALHSSLLLTQASNIQVVSKISTAGFHRFPETQKPGNQLLSGLFFYWLLFPWVTVPR